MADKIDLQTICLDSSVNNDSGCPVCGDVSYFGSKPGFTYNYQPFYICSYHLSKRAFSKISLSGTITKDEA